MLNLFKSCNKLSSLAVPKYTTKSLFTQYSSTAPVPLSKLSESFLDGTSAVYIENLHEQWVNDPQSVHTSWAQFFQNVENGLQPGEHKIGNIAAQITGPNAKIVDTIKATLLLRHFQVRGHALANLDPLGIAKRKPVKELEPSFYGFSPADLEKEIFFGDPHLTGIANQARNIKLADLISQLNDIYCGNVGVEFMHIQEKDNCNYIREMWETEWTKNKISNETKILLLKRLAKAELFENFLGKKFSNTKRFGVDGCEVLIPALNTLIDKGGELGIEDFILGMPHRGRLNVLANVVQKDLAQIFFEFDGGSRQVGGKNAFLGSGDVKYHLGTSRDIETSTGKQVHISLQANPSHLEAVNPVVNGKTRAKQFYKKDINREKVVSVLMHGDQAFAGQGVVYETIDLDGLKNYATGGTIHIIVNNQVGFTTDPKKTRNSEYCTDVAKTNQVPIFHVNGDDIEAVYKVFDLAVEYRQKFHQDVVIDIVCYRRYGHNEIDEPAFTQPLMYKAIKNHPTPMNIYAQKLISEGTISEQDFTNLKSEIEQDFEAEHKKGKTFVPKNEWLDSYWKGFKGPHQYSLIKHTGVPIQKLKEVGSKLCEVPSTFSLHKGIEKIFERRKLSLEKEVEEKVIDWGTAENLAYGTLLDEGNHVRISGQDCERGTFSHRHATVIDQKTGESYSQLSNLSAEQAEFTVSNSSLSEFAILGFELGYSMENPNSLVVWEAQFGDFANGAQIIFDQFLSSGEQKWQRQSGLVCLLPHGYEGQGPEHSSARLERFLQLSDSDPRIVPDMSFDKRKQLQDLNWQVVNCTTPANIFHVLRRQIHRDFRKPLIVMSPKSLLRHPRAVSALDEFDDIGDDTRFQRAIPEQYSSDLVEPNKIKQLVFCSGKVYYDLLEEREKKGHKDTALVRVEQLAPFPFDHIKTQSELYSNANVLWVQEEPQNMGAWNFVHQHMKTVLGDKTKYVGRPPSGSTATGRAAQHKTEQQDILDTVFNI